ncbi:MAG TPA: DUF502 domain-containing protein [Chitinophagaceae bacterium]|jgi:uncharacterized membrane protein|nr:DUF502 domain-containing protein [Chitinophagaceae bacterium]
MNTRVQAIRKLTSKRILQFFLQGILTLAPIAITGYLLYWLFDKIDSILRPYLNIPGLGFAIILVFVLLVGWASSNLFMGGILNVFDSWLERTPGVKFIYSTFKDFFEAFAGEKRKFNKPVLANIDHTDVWRVGFITQDDMTDWGLQDFVAVYVPMAYSIAGNVYLLPVSRIKPVTNVNASDAMKFAISGGVTAVDDDK